MLQALLLRCQHSGSTTSTACTPVLFDLRGPGMACCASCLAWTRRRLQHVVHASPTAGYDTAQDHNNAATAPAGLDLSILSLRRGELTELNAVTPWSPGVAALAGSQTRALRQQSSFWWAFSLLCLGSLPPLGARRVRGQSGGTTPLPLDGGADVRTGGAAQLYKGAGRGSPQHRADVA